MIVLHFWCASIRIRPAFAVLCHSVRPCKRYGMYQLWRQKTKRTDLMVTRKTRYSTRVILIGGPDRKRNALPSWVLLSTVLVCYSIRGARERMKPAACHCCLTQKEVSTENETTAAIVAYHGLQQAPGGPYRERNLLLNIILLLSSWFLQDTASLYPRVFARDGIQDFLHRTYRTCILFFLLCSHVWAAASGS